MAQIGWTGPGATFALARDGFWEIASNWNTGLIPGPNDFVITPPGWDAVNFGLLNITIGLPNQADHVKIEGLFLAPDAFLNLSAGSSLTVGGVAGALIDSTVFGSIRGSGVFSFAYGDLKLRNHSGIGNSSAQIDHATITVLSGSSGIAAGIISNSTISLATGKPITRFNLDDQSILTNVKLEGSGFSQFNDTNDSAFDNVGSATVSGLTIGGDSIVSCYGELSQTGGNVVVGDGSTSATGQAVIETFFLKSYIVVNGEPVPTSFQTSYKITDDSDILSGAANALIANAGLLEKTGGGGKSVVEVAIANTGVITAASGTLDIASTVWGVDQVLRTTIVGHLNIESGATLAFGGFVAPGQALSFIGADDRLQLDDAKDFHALINGFATGETIDLAGFSGADDQFHYTPTSGSTDGNLLIASGSQIANLHFSGTYQTSDFHIASDTHGGTLLTLA